MRAAAERLLAPQFRVVGRLIDEPMLQPIYDLESPRLAFGRVAIIGDAAFVARPHVAAGVSKAADDAAALAAALDADQVEAALLRLVAERLPVGARSSNARDTSAPICRRRRAPRIAHASMRRQLPSGKK
jgi:2-polyprenyl-6-methoxyphenol hydroxylase-like FAD-dependent oxidoreductase